MLTLKDVKIEIGTWLYFETGSDNISKAMLIGIRSEKYIATTYPIPRISLKDAEELTIYFPNSGKVYEFKSRIIKFFNDPIEFLLLQYPEHISIREQRSYKRIKCFVSARVYYNINGRSKMMEGIIKDVSKKGCRVTFLLKDIEKGTFNKNEYIIIECKFPGILGEQRIKGIIRNIIETSDQISLGIEFDEYAWWAPPY